MDDPLSSVTIRTRRFVLREYQVSDEEAFVRYQSDPRFMIYHTAEERGADHARRVFRTFLAWQAQKPRLNYQFAVCQAAGEGDLVGSCGIRRIAPAINEADFGIELARPYWGRHGFAIEISAAVISWAFAHFSLDALTADTAFDNKVAARLAQRAGFARTGAGEKELWRLERERWEALVGSGGLGRVLKFNQP